MRTETCVNRAPRCSLKSSRSPSSAAPALQAALKDPDSQVRVNGAVALSGIAGQVHEAVPVLVTALKDRTLGSVAVEALGRAGPEAKAAFPALLSTLQDQASDPKLVARLGWALQQIGGGEVVPALEQALVAAREKSRPAHRPGDGANGTGRSWLPYQTGGQPGSGDSRHSHKDPEWARPE